MQRLSAKKVETNFENEFNVSLCDDRLLGLPGFSKSSFRETLQCQNKTQIHLCGGRAKTEW
jgi:hypothetical protein